MSPEDFLLNYRLRLKYGAHLVLGLAGDPNDVLIEPMEKKIQIRSEEHLPSMKLLSSNCSLMAFFYQLVKLVAII